MEKREREKKNRYSDLKKKEEKKKGFFNPRLPTFFVMILSII